MDVVDGDICTIFYEACHLNPGIIIFPTLVDLYM